MHERLVSIFSAPVPRYTSYPSAPHFHAGITAETYREWLEALTPETSLSLYIHVPFCDKLCWFCACHTKQTRSYAPVHRYVDALLQEIATVGSLVGDAPVSALHFGGGSPTMLCGRDLMRIGDAVRSAFRMRPDAEISVEIDPSDMDEDRFDALAELGLTRASLGVQDFDPVVQHAINREQSLDLTRRIVEGVRARGVRSVNIDLLYGLPNQTVASVEATARSVLSLSPDRIALYGYAHVPWFKRHQVMIDEAALPDARARLAQFTAAAERIVADGYCQIGLDHFAKPTDDMAVAAKAGTLRRNFQGYTVDEADAVIGLGASSIGRLPQGYVQNQSATANYERSVTNGGLAVVRGIRLSEEDRVRAFVIERLMCDFSLSRHELIERFGEDAEAVLRDADSVAASDRHGVFLREGDSYRIPASARPFVRTIASRFDAYLDKGAGRHSSGV